MNAERTSLDDWVGLFASRDEFAVEYARLFWAHGADWQCWPALNLAVVDRWSEAGLRYVKRQAWKRLKAGGAA